MYPATVSMNHEAYYTSYPRRIETCIHDHPWTYHRSRACSVPGSQVLIEGCSTVKDPSLSVTNQIRCESQRKEKHYKSASHQNMQMMWHGIQAKLNQDTNDNGTRFTLTMSVPLTVFQEDMSRLNTVLKMNILC